MNHDFFMEKAIYLAGNALINGEFPVGCVIVHEERIIAAAARYGTKSRSVHSETDHAEILALKKLEDSGFQGDRAALTIYCNLEPCLMCFGAILISGIRNIVFAYEDVMGGGTACDLVRLPELYSKWPVVIVPGIMRNESLFLFKKYFSNPLNNYWNDSLLARYSLEADYLT